MKNIKDLRVIKWIALKRYNWKGYDISLVVVVLVLSVVSSVILSVVQSDFSPVKQIISVISAFILLTVVSLIDYHTICSYVALFYVIVTIMVAATRLSPLGYDYSTNSYRWLNLKIINFQPSELAKIVIILTLATFFKRQLEKNIKSFKTFFIACLITFIPTGFIMIQSDLSSSVVIVMVMVMMLASSGVGRRVLGPVAAVVIPVGIFLFWYIQQPGQILLQGYQLERIMGWLHPETEALDTMYQQNNSILSIASGKLYGKMISDVGDVSRNYASVSVRDSDFIWSPIGEEFGFIGCLVILVLLSFIIIKCFITAKNSKDYLGMMIAIGIGSMYCFQIFFNIGVATSLLPNTGLPLPFLSYGLSSLLSNMIAIGIILNIGIQPVRGNATVESYI